MKSYLLNFIVGILFITFSGCTKDDFTWGVKKRPCVVSLIYSSENYIKFISISGMTNSTDGTSAPNYFEKKPVEVIKGQNYDLNLEFVMNSLEYDHVGVFAYFDWNCDGDFLDTNEGVLLNNNVNLTNIAHSISVPADAVKGITYARFIIQPSYYPVYQDPCIQDYSTGEVEDYPLIIK